MFFVETDVQSKLLGNRRAVLVYAIVENTAFCGERVLPKEGGFSHVIHVRYGAGFGGSRGLGSWMLNALEALHCECFITDNHYFKEGGDRFAQNRYPNLRFSGKPPQLRKIREIEG